MNGHFEHLQSKCPHLKLVITTTNFKYAFSVTGLLANSLITDVPVSSNDKKRKSMIYDLKIVREGVQNTARIIEYYICI